MIEPSCPATDRHGMSKRVGDLHVIAHPLGLKDFYLDMDERPAYFSESIGAFSRRHHVTRPSRSGPSRRSTPSPSRLSRRKLYEVVVTGWAWAAGTRGWPSRR